VRVYGIFKIKIPKGFTVNVAMNMTKGIWPMMRPIAIASVKVLQMNIVAVIQRSTFISLIVN
jgi:hypothetical protein